MRRPRTCEICGSPGKYVALRSIKMRHGEREDLCKSCFRAALDKGDVHPTDPRVEWSP